MIEYKQSVSKFVPVRILNGSDVPVAGIAFGAVTATVVKADGTTQAVTITITDWAEVVTGAFASQGFYLLKLSAANLDQPGMLTYAVSTAGNKTYINTLKVIANEEAETFARVGAPVLASISADIAGVKTDVGTANTGIAALSTGQSSILTVVTLLKKYEQGRWKIHISGGDANRLVLYDTDNTTALLKFDLKSNSGSATFINPFERYPVP